MRGRRIVILGWSDSVHIQRWVSGLSERGYDIRLISPGGAPLDGIDTIILPRSSRLDYLRQIATVREHIIAFKPDLVHAHYASSLGLWAARSGFAPTIVSVWGSDITSFGSHWWGRMVLRHVFNRATVITATSRFLQEAIDRLDPSVGSKTTVIPFGVDLPAVRVPLPEGETFKIAFLKSHRPVYGPDILIRAFALARAKNPCLQLNLAGRGSMTDELQSLAGSLGVADAVTFVGWLDRPQIYPFLEQQHLLAMPSRMESFGVAALEAAACGRPVVATDVGGVSEVVRDGVTGLLVANGDINALAAAIVKIAGDRGFARALGEHGYEMARDEFAWSQSLDLMTQTYERLLYDAKTNSAVRH